MKYYFESKLDDTCYPEKYFIDMMKSDNEKEMNVFEAIPDKIKTHFYCEKHGIIDKGDMTCGKWCCYYKPRNKKSGCCVNRTDKLYIKGKMIKLKLKETKNKNKT